jgi:hypothetical protein
MRINPGMMMDEVVTVIEAAEAAGEREDMTEKK